ncbi:protein MIZU-KUSSEI 1-like [Typha latifolia]|uniref:protein MIZU-KUSSEI 1-like n=1 Tax=Typha latifolia TaxID=4733 RepID=UPI003C30432B
MRMIDLGGQRGPLQIIDTPTAVDCTKDVRFRRSFRSLVECMVPYCLLSSSSSSSSSSSCADTDSCSSTTTTTTTVNNTTTTVTGTFFGYRRGRVSFCFHDDSRSSTSPLLLLDFAVPTAYLAKEMKHGLLRIALECDRATARSSSSASLFAVPVWSMYCNGRKVGYAVRRHMTEVDAAVFKMMRSVSAGAGVLPGTESKAGDGNLMYLRASFERVTGSVDSESFHMINPVGSIGQQQLSIFLLRT